MDNKKIGMILLVICLVLTFLFLTINSTLNAQAEASCSCAEMEDEGYCPHETTNWQTYAGIFIIALMAALAFYMIFFDKSQKEIVSTLEKQKHMQIEEEKYEILMKGLDPDEQKVIRAVREQDGITQQTLRLRVDMHKSKLSIVVDGLVKKNLIKKVPKGKTNQLFIKIAL